MPDSSPSAPYARSERFQNIVAVARSALGDRLQADALADSLGVPNLGVVRPRDIRDFPVLLFLDEQGLGLQMTGKGAPGPVRAEFVTGKMGYRREHGGGAGQLVASAKSRPVCQIHRRERVVPGRCRQQEQRHAQGGHGEEEKPSA